MSMPRVALLIETSRGYGRQLLRGVAHYARLHGPWGFYVTPGDLVQALPRMKTLGGTGIIARVETPAVARVADASGLARVSYLAQALRLEYGVTPARYRRQMRDGSTETPAEL